MEVFSVSRYEALILVLLFGAYIAVLLFNARIEYYSLLKVREDLLRLAAFQEYEGRAGPGLTPCPGTSCLDQVYHVHGWRSKAR